MYLFLHVYEHLSAINCLLFLFLSFHKQLLTGQQDICNPLVTLTLIFHKTVFSIDGINKYCGSMCYIITIN